MNDAENHWGPEFCSTYFEALLARYECIKKARPPAKARFGVVGRAHVRHDEHAVPS